MIEQHRPAVEGTNLEIGGDRCPAYLLGVWTILNLVFGSIRLAPGVYLSQLTLLALCYIMAIRYCLMLRYARLAGSIALFIIALSWVFAAGGEYNVRFVQEFLKLILVLVPALLIGGSLRWEDVESICRWVPGVLLLIMFLVYFLGLGDYYGEGGRFGVPWWGSPNNTGFVITVAVAMSIYEIKNIGYEGMPSRLWNGQRWFWWSQLFLLVVFLCATQSLGALLMLSVVGLRFVGVSLKLIMYGAVVLIFSFVLIVFVVHVVDIPVLLGSGRLLIWETLMGDQFNHSVLAWFIGLGPGGIDFTPWFTARVESAHSMYIEVLYGYGLFGLCLFVFEICYNIRILISTEIEEPQRFLLEAIFCALVVGFFVDTYLMTAQLTWLGALLLGFRGLLLRRKGSRCLC